MKNITILTIILFALLFSGCKKFLDVQPIDRVTQEQALESEAMIATVLNGLYMQMTTNNLYGGHLTMSLVECLAQRYNVLNETSAGAFYHMTRASSPDYITNNINKSAENANAAIWESMYVQILAINDFIDVLDKETVIPSERRKNWMRGEALAMRAFHHFDILRLWGPSPAFPDDDPFMPYHTLPDGKQTDFLTADVVLQNILTDLNEAEILLETDPIRTVGIDTVITNDFTLDFFIRRNLRLNYYAVKAIQARVHMWMGNTTDALTAAMVIINEGFGNAFSWLNPTHITTDQNPDRIFMSELIFGVRNAGMYSNYESWFRNDLTGSSSSELAPRLSRLEAVYDVYGIGARDFRYAYMWKEKPNDNYLSFYKYAPPNNPDYARLYPIRNEYIQPLIRVSEIFYIAAECLANQLGWNMFNAVRNARNIISDPSMPPPFPGSVTALNEEIMKEYRKEFYGEGQLYYYYKRRGINVVPSAIDETGDRTITMRLPIPLKELDYR